MNRMLVERAPRRMPLSSSRRSDAKARTRRKVLDAARSLFMERGYEAATIRDIAARANLSTGAVFANFSDKTDLFNAVLAEDMEHQVDLVKDARSPDMPMEQALLELCRSGYRFHLERLPLLQAATGLSWSHGLNGPLGNRPAYSLAKAAIDEILARGRERGELPSAADGDLIGEMLWDAYLANYRRALFDGWGLDQLMARLARQMRVLLAGALAAPA